MGWHGSREYECVGGAILVVGNLKDLIHAISRPVMDKFAGDRGATEPQRYWLVITR